MYIFFIYTYMYTTYIINRVIIIRFIPFVNVPRFYLRIVVSFCFYRSCQSESICTECALLGRIQGARYQRCQCHLSLFYV